MTDVPKLFIIRYKRNVTEESDKPEGRPKSIWDSLRDQELDPAAQLVAKYNGSDEISEVCDCSSRSVNWSVRKMPRMEWHTLIITLLLLFSFFHSIFFADHQMDLTDNQRW